jgi:hypothetical protein
MTGSLVSPDLVGYPAPYEPGLSFVIKIDILDSFKIVGTGLLQRYIVGRSLLPAQGTMCLRDELLLGLAHIVDLLLVAEVDVRVLKACE